MMHTSVRLCFRRSWGYGKRLDKLSQTMFSCVRLPQQVAGFIGLSTQEVILGWR